MVETRGMEDSKLETREPDYRNAFSGLNNPAPWWKSFGVMGAFLTFCLCGFALALWRGSDGWVLVLIFGGALCWGVYDRWLTHKENRPHGSG